MTTRPKCQPGCTLFQSTCYCDCPLNSVPANEDPTKCVDSLNTCQMYATSIGQPTSLISDPTFSLSCIKVGRPPEIGGLCATGFTAWQSGTCYINCPPGLIENGLTCLKRPLVRAYEVPTCGDIIWSFDGTGCSLNYVFVVLAIIAFFFLYRIFFLKQSAYY